jgi:hypothetical protein
MPCHFPRATLCAAVVTAVLPLAAIPSLAFVVLPCHPLLLPSPSCHPPPCRPLPLSSHRAAPCCVAQCHHPTTLHQFYPLPRVAFCAAIVLTILPLVGATLPLMPPARLPLAIILFTCCPLLSLRHPSPCHPPSCHPLPSLSRRAAPCCCCATLCCDACRRATPASCAAVLPCRLLTLLSCRAAPHRHCATCCHAAPHRAAPCQCNPLRWQPSSTPLFLSSQLACLPIYHPFSAHQCHHRLSTCRMMFIALCCCLLHPPCHAATNA